MSPLNPFRRLAITLTGVTPPRRTSVVQTGTSRESLGSGSGEDGTTTRLKHSKSSSNDWFQIFPNARFGELFRETYRVLRRNTHFYLLCDAETMFVAKPIAVSEFLALIESFVPRSPGASRFVA